MKDVQASGRVLVALLVACSCGEAVLSSSPTDAGPETGADARAKPMDSSDAGSIAEGDASACLIVGSNYDQTCSTDSDCVGVAGNLPVQFGDYCTTTCLCGGDAINESAAAQYQADVFRTPLGSGAYGLIGCGSCPGTIPPCCRSGRCATACPTPGADAIDGAAQDAG